MAKVLISPLESLNGIGVFGESQIIGSECLTYVILLLRFGHGRHVEGD